MTTVAVVVPTRDGAERIGACVRALAGQTRPPDEVVVVDNGSTDGTAEAARAAGARVVHEAVPGSYAARNRGIAATTAEVVAFTDDDCEPEPEWLEHLVGAFDDDPDLAGAGGEIVAASPPSTVAERWARERDVLSQASNWRHAYLPFFATANAAYRRSALEAVGGFEAALRSGGDVDLAWRVQAVAGGRLAFVPEARVRHHHRTSLRGLLRQQRSYARGHGRLDGRWGDDPRYRAAAGTPRRRLRAVWLLPGRLAWRAARRRPLWLPLLDGAVRTVHEVGRREGHRDPAIELVAARRGGGC